MSDRADGAFECVFELWMHICCIFHRKLKSRPAACARLWAAGGCGSSFAGAELIAQSMGPDRLRRRDDRRRGVHARLLERVGAADEGHDADSSLCVAEMCAGLTRPSRLPRRSAAWCTRSVQAHPQVPSSGARWPYRLAATSSGRFAQIRRRRRRLASGREARLAREEHGRVKLYSRPGV